MGKHTRVPLASIKALTLHEGRMTNARRAEPVPQLHCTGKFCTYAPDVVQCSNVGDDGTGAQWRCEADLPSGLRFGQIQVTCEGWRRSGDSDVLAGSCGLEYELVRTPGFKGTLHESTRSGSGNSSWWPLLIFVAIVAAFFWFGRRNNAGARGGTDGRGGGGGGGGGGGNGAGGGGYSRYFHPPPPYSQKPPEPGPSTASGSGSGFSGPGFWSGLAAGAAGATMYNRMGSGRDRNMERELEWERMQARERERDRQREQDREQRNLAPRWDDNPGETRRATGFGGTSTR